jgi:hypothetical protein
LPFKPVGKDSCQLILRENRREQNHEGIITARKTRNEENLLENNEERTFAVKKQEEKIAGSKIKDGRIVRAGGEADKPTAFY